MKSTFIWALVSAAVSLTLSSGCSSPTYLYSLSYSGYRASALASAPGNTSDALRFDIDTIVAAGGKLRLRITNVSDKPLILHKRFANLARLDTVISNSPFEDDPFLEYSFSQSSSSDYSSSRSGHAAALYPLTNEYLSTRSSGFAMSSSSASTITRKAISETILYPKQVASFSLNDIVASWLDTPVSFNMESNTSSPYQAVFALNSSSSSREYIDQGVSVLKDAFKAFGKRPVTLFLTYTDLSGEGYRTATYSFTFSDLLVDVKSIRMN